MYLNGTGVEKDYAQALSWFQKSAAAGNAMAENTLGWMYLNGLGVEKDYAQALSLFEKSAGAKNALAENNLGWMYQNGAGVNKDYAQALSWFQKSAAAGNELAENNLGLMYLNGEGVNKDYVQAFSWFQKSAAAKNAMAENNLGSMYRNGLGVTQSYQVARVWYQKAADAGSDLAENNLRELVVLENARETLSSEQTAAVVSHLTGSGGSYAGGGTRGPVTPRTGDGPSYAETISFIEEKLNGSANAAYTLSRHNKSTGKDTTVHYSTRASRAAGDSGNCHLSFHYKAAFMVDPKAAQDTVMADTDMGFDFQDVGEIRVFSREVDSNSRFPGYTARYAPEIFALGIVTKDNVLRYLFDFRDEDLADRAGKALWHAVELCGGQN
jgi:TPR repeat protein